MRVGMLTGGGDCPGLNAVIRGAVLKGVISHDTEFVGFRNGWRGVVERDIMAAIASSLIIQRSTAKPCLARARPISDFG